MNADVGEEPLSALPEYAAIPISFCAGWIASTCRGGGCSARGRRDAWSARRRSRSARRTWRCWRGGGTWPCSGTFAWRRTRAGAWAAARGCTRLKIETQNVNVPAYRFYAAQGCVLGAIHRFDYPDLPGEAQLLWYRDLQRRPGGYGAVIP